MRICLATDTFLPEVNGVTTVLHQMWDGLRHRGHEVLILAPAYERDPFEGDARVVRLGAVPAPGYPQVRLSWPWGRGLGRVVEQFRPTLVHAVTEGPLGLFGRGFARRRRLPLATSFHTDFPRYASRYAGAWAAEPTRAYLRWFHGAAGITQTPSEVTRAELQALGLAQATVWGRGVDTAFFRPERRSLERRRAMGVADDQLLVLHVGRLAVEKDVETLAVAFTRAREQLAERAAFCVAGDGPRAPWVRASLPWAHHRGFLPRPTLADLYADADVFVFPSPTETCGLVALEALSSGVPVVGSDAGGIRENLRQGLTGLIVPAGAPAAFAAGIVHLALEGGQRLAMREAARAFAVGRDWSRELDALEEAYASLSESRRAVPAPRIWPTTTSVT